MKKLVLTLTLAIAALLSFAQIPQSFSYQAVVRDAENQLIVSKPMIVELSILQGSDDGMLVYSEKHVVTSNQNGLISLKMGAGVSSDDFSAIDWSNAPYFVKTEIEVDGKTIVGVTPLLAVPYALYAAKAGSADVDLSNYATKDEIPSTEGFATKEELNALDIPSVEGLASESYVNEKVAAIDLNDYYPKADVDAILAEMNAKISKLEQLNPPIVVKGAIKAAFSVSDTKQVYFSQGNLQYQASTGTWKFADNQYDIIGEDNANISETNDGWIDLFGWGTSGWNIGANAYQPYSTSTEYSDYYPGGSYSNNLTGSYANADWGEYNKISNGGNATGTWRTLTQSEWDYLISGRAQARRLSGRGKVNGVYGLILLPDEWNAPLSVNFDCGNYGTNTYSQDEWAVMQSYGAVFLPAAGYRNGTNVGNVNSLGAYWSSSYSNNDEAAYSFYYSNDRALMTDLIRSRNQGLSVRLVKVAFKTSSGMLPTITTGEATEVGISKATVSGNVTGGDGTLDRIIERGVCWATTKNPTVADYFQNTSGTGNGEFTITLTDLSPGTTYYARAYASSREGRVYGNVVTFTTQSIESSTIMAGFSVSDSKQVYFSQGNLQYQASSGTWRFAEHQYDIIGDGNANISEDYDGWIDLFGWGTSGWNSGANAYQPYSTSTEYSDYYPGGSYSNNLTGSYPNADWGVYNKISNGGNQAGQWRTLNNEEWYYLINSRTNASSKKGVATVNNVTGLVLLPDDWTLPADVTFTSGTSGDYAQNNYSASDWSKMEANGAVFLPAAGTRRGTNVGSFGILGYYWSSSAYNITSADCLAFYSDDVSVGGGGGRDSGRSVRVVQDAE